MSDEKIAAALRKEIDEIADQLCLSVKGDFDFTINTSSKDEVIQKLSLLINFVMDAARRSLKEVMKKNEQLTELDKLKSEFVTNISHELRTPLTLLLGPLELILQDQSLVLPSHHLENVLRIRRNAAKLYFIVNDLLDFSKIDAGCFALKNELLDLNDYLFDLVDDAQGLAKERSITLHYSGVEHLGLILTDRKVIEKITLNLLSNALKFTPDHGSIEVQLCAHSDKLTLTVCDTGVGIDSKHIKHIFERFYQVDSATYAGTGIGLALVKQFVKLLGGTIAVTSNVGKGTSFTVTIPTTSNIGRGIGADEESHAGTSDHTQTELWLLAQMMSEPQTTTAQQTHHVTEDSDKRPTVLIADDSADMRAFMQVLLEDRFDIILAENGVEALNIIGTREPQVILTDAMMPQMDGYQLTKAVKSNSKTRHIPVILVTAKTGNEAIISGLDVGADDYLSKPFLPEELIARIQASLRTYYDYVALTQANLKLEQEIEERKKLEFKNNELNSQLVLAARQAGMADIVASVLHNIGNVLNSANISTTMINHRITHSRVADLEKITTLLQENKDNIGTYLTKDKTGKHIIQYIGLLANTWKEDYNNLVNETKLLRENIEHIKNIIIQQQFLGRTIGFNEKTSIPELIEHCISFNNINDKMIDIFREYEPLKEVVIDKVKLMQIIVNLIKNSIDALQESKATQKQITVRTYEQDEHFFIIQISDNGIGIAPEHLEKIFSHGFTTKKTGHGYGLHASAISMQEMNGQLTVYSEGLETGATFTLLLPYNPLNGEADGTKANSCSG